MVTDSWEQAKGSAARLGYEQRKSTKQEIVLGLLNRAGNGRWDALTVGNSMRETENELNLLLPGSGDIFAVPYGAPAWTFQPSDADGTGVEVPEGDEMGVSELNGKGK